MDSTSVSRARSSRLYAWFTPCAQQGGVVPHIGGFKGGYLGGSSALGCHSLAGSGSLQAVALRCRLALPRADVRTAPKPAPLTVTPRDHVLPDG